MIYRQNKGFTLVELIIVIAILAIIMLIAIPNFSGIQQRMQVRADKSSAAQICKAVRIWYTDNYATKNQSAIPELMNDAEPPEIMVVPYTKLNGIGEHIASDLVAESLLEDGAKYDGGGTYYITLLYSGISTKFLIGIDKDAITEDGYEIAPTLDRPTDEVTESDIKYDGSKPDWVFLEK